MKQGNGWLNAVIAVWFVCATLFVLVLFSASCATTTLKLPRDSYAATHECSEPPLEVLGAKVSFCGEVGATMCCGYSTRFQSPVDNEVTTSCGIIMCRSGCDVDFVFAGAVCEDSVNESQSQKPEQSIR